MPEHDLKNLLEAMPRIADVVNKFKSEEVQKLAFQQCLKFLVIEDIEMDNQEADTKKTKPGIKDGRKQSNKRTASQVESTKKEKGRQRRRATPSLVKDLNLRPLGKKALFDFFQDKQPNSNQKMFAVFVYYLKNEADVSAITPDHIYTCFKHLKKPIPKNLTGALHTAANRDEYIETSNIQDIQITSHGENFVEYELPPKAKNGE